MVSGRISISGVEAEGDATCEPFSEVVVADEDVSCQGFEAVPSQEHLMSEDGAVSMEMGCEGNLSVGPEVEGGEEGGDVVDEGVSGESRDNLRDVEVCEYEMEVARICLGENGEY